MLPESGAGIDMKQPRPEAGAVGLGLLAPAGFSHTIGNQRQPVKYRRHTVTADRVITYIDGYNLYYGLRAAGLHSSRWLDLRALCDSLLKPDQQLDLVRYFTTRVRNDRAANRRQSVFIDALLARGRIEIDYGHFLSKPVTCRRCGNTWQ